MSMDPRLLRLQQSLAPSAAPPVNLDDKSSYFRYGAPRQMPVPMAPQMQPPPMQAPLRAAQGTLVNGPGSGRDDQVPAQLSPGEYIMDAETVALLGDGSVEEGARRLDEMRRKIRSHKGQKLVRGEFSDNAKQPEQYLEGK